MNPQALELNKTLETVNPVVLDLLSEKGKNIFFPRMGILGQSADAKGTKINATIGAAFEDDGSPMRLSSIEKLVNLKPNEVFPYAPSFGRPEIRKKWKEMIYRKNPALEGIELSNPCVSNALTHGLSILGYLFVNEGDKILIPDLYWGNYNLIFKNAYGAEFETYNTFKNDGFDVAALKEKLLSGEDKKIVLLNFPNNPTGYTPTIKEMQDIVAALKEAAEAGKKIAVICDDAYFGLVFEEGVETQSLFAYIADLHKNILAIKTDGPTKEDYVWGFRVGFITYGIKGATPEFYAALENKTGGAVRGNISNSCNLSQSILLHAFEAENYWDNKKEKFDILKGRYEKIKELLAKNPQYNEVFETLPVNSGYFMCLKLNKGLDGEKIRKILIDEFSTGVINMSNVLRLAFSCVIEEDLPTLFENIYQACKKV